MNFLHTLCLMMGLSCGGAEGEDPRAAYYSEYIGKNIAELTVQDLAGETVTFQEFVGRPVVLNLWATWCPPCIKELPNLARLGQQGEFVVIALSVDGKAGTVENFLAKNKVDTAGLTLWHDAWGRGTRVALGASQYPITYLLDETATVRAIYTGVRAWDAAPMIAKLRAVLGQ
jgi:thiol-disulfide isomerase/thioredoxin